MTDMQAENEHTGVELKKRLYALLSKQGIHRF